MSSTKDWWMENVESEQCSFVFLCMFMWLKQPGQTCIMFWKNSVIDVSRHVHKSSCNGSFQSKTENVCFVFVHWFTDFTLLHGILHFVQMHDISMMNSSCQDYDVMYLLHSNLFSLLYSSVSFLCFVWRISAPCQTKRIYTIKNLTRLPFSSYFLNLHFFNKACLDHVSCLCMFGLCIWCCSIRGQ